MIHAAACIPDNGWGKTHPVTRRKLPTGYRCCYSKQVSIGEMTLLNSASRSEDVLRICLGQIFHAIKKRPAARCCGSLVCIFK